MRITSARTKLESISRDAGEGLEAGAANGRKAEQCLVHTASMLWVWVTWKPWLVVAFQSIMRKPVMHEFTHVSTKARSKLLVRDAFSSVEGVSPSNRQNETREEMLKLLHNCRL